MSAQFEFEAIQIINQLNEILNKNSVIRKGDVIAEELIFKPLEQVRYNCARRYLKK